MDGTLAAAGIIPDGFEELAEGCAKALYKKGEVFYNPVQVVNRDLSVQVLRWFVRERGHDAPPIKILEALSASGMRSVRYFKEVPRVGSIVANDMDPNAVETIRTNVLHNGLNPKTDIIPNLGDAIDVLNVARTRGKQYDWVDLDPYGSAAPFLESSVQAVSDGGILAVTCTDLPVLCGNSPEICFGRYNATPLKGAHCHEMAVRIVLASIQKAANRHGRAVEPIVCAKIDFYVRLFVRVRNSKHLAQMTPSKLSLVFQCTQCSTQHMQPLGRIRPITKTSSRKRRRFGKKENGSLAQGPISVENNGSDTKKPNSTAQPLRYKFSPPLVENPVSSNCTICEGTMMMGGPIWGDRLVNQEAAQSILTELDKKEGQFAARSRVEAILRLLCEEVPNASLFMQLPAMCRVLKVASPPSASVRSALVSRGYQVSQSHTDPLALKTDAPPELIWDILRLWVAKVGNPFVSKEGADNERVETGARILKVPASLISQKDVDFTVKRDKFVRKGAAAPLAARFPQNPMPEWGPKARAGKRKRESS